MLTCFGKSTRKATLGFDTFSRLNQEVFPVRLVTAHAVFLSTRLVFKSFVSLFVRASETLQFLKGRIVVHDHSSSSSESLLQKHGFGVEGLPKAPLGGLFTFGCFKGWLADRQRLELSRFASNAAAADHLAVGAIEDERRKRKRLDAAYSRRKRYRKRIEVAVMHEEVERLRQQNAKLRKEEHLLAKSLFEARTFVKNNFQLLGCCNQAVRENPSSTMPSAPPVLYYSLPSGHGTPCIDVAKIGLHPLARDVGGVAPPYSICVQPPHLASPYGAVPSVDPNRSLQHWAVLLEAQPRPSWRASSCTRLPGLGGLGAYSGLVTAEQQWRSLASLPSPQETASTRMGAFQVPFLVPTTTHDHSTSNRA
jgi:hypothetical protein